MQIYAGGLGALALPEAELGLSRAHGYLLRRVHTKQQHHTVLLPCYIYAVCPGLQGFCSYANHSNKWLA